MRRLWIGLGAGVVLTAVGLAVMTAGLIAPSIRQHQPANGSCRLPILLSRSGTAGFLQYPDRTFITVAAPPSGSESYDAALGRWLPVPWYDIAPDGRHYAYTVPPVSEQADSSEVHVVEATDDRVVWHGPGKAVLDGMDGRNVYFTVIGRGVPVTSVVPLHGGQPEAVHGGGILGPDGGFWGTDARQDVVRYDPGTGSRTIWWSTADTPGSIFANPATFDAARHPVIVVEGMEKGSQVVLLTTPHQLTPVAAAGQLSDPSPASVVGDAHGIWIGRDDGSVALWTSGHGLTEMLPALPDGRGNPALILGPCA